MFVKKKVFLPKHMIMTQTIDRLLLVTPTEAALLESEPSTVATVNYRASLDRDTQMSLHKEVAQNSDEKLNHNRDEQSPAIERPCFLTQTVLKHSC